MFKHAFKHILIYQFATLYSKIIQNSTTSGNWTSIKLVWEAPKDGYLAGNITFR